MSSRRGRAARFRGLKARKRHRCTVLFTTDEGGAEVQLDGSSARVRRESRLLTLIAAA